MDYSVLETSSLFSGVPAEELRATLMEVPHHIQCYDKGEVLFRLMEPALWVGILLEGRVEAQKPFPNGSQVNVSVRVPGEMIGPAAAFSRSRVYPCDIVALEPVTAMMFTREDLLALMRCNAQVLENFTTEMASAAYMLQQRLELMSYNGIAQKAVFWLLIQSRKTNNKQVRIPESVSKWAMLMNVSRPSLHRELSKLASEELIRYEPPVIELLDEEKLTKLLEK